MYNNDKATRDKLPTDTDLAYIAAFVDGEGSINIYRKYGTHLKKTWNTNYQERVSITQTDMRPLLFIRQFFPGGSITLKKRYDPSNKPCWTLKYTTLKAYKLLKAIRPYMQVKDKEADLAIRYREEIVLIDRTQYSKTKWLPEEEIERREAIYAEMKQLNITRGRGLQSQRLSEKTSDEDEAIVRSA
jgi:hypothetical protein